MLKKPKTKRNLFFSKFKTLIFWAIIAIALFSLNYILIRSVSTSRSQNSFKLTAKLQPIRTLNEHSSWIYASAVSSRQQILATADYKGEIALWNLATNSLIKTISAHGDAISSLDISPDGHLVSDKCGGE